ncbi:hypothetical protein BDW62DRAFT_194534 [Aspergillus aurantiobrunneus]
MHLNRNCAHGQPLKVHPGRPQTAAELTKGPLYHCAITLGWQHALEPARSQAVRRLGVECRRKSTIRQHSGFRKREGRHCRLMLKNNVNNLEWFTYQAGRQKKNFETTNLSKGVPPPSRPTQKNRLHTRPGRSSGRRVGGMSHERCIGHRVVSGHLLGEAKHSSGKVQDFPSS